jgi:hypothetical protein
MGSGISFGLCHYASGQAEQRSAEQKQFTQSELLARAVCIGLKLYRRKHQSTGAGRSQLNAGAEDRQSQWIQIQNSW